MLDLAELLQFKKAKKLQKNLIGMEIEVEGHHLPGDLENWHITSDGSLQGESCEYVLRTPQNHEGVQASLDELQLAFRDSHTIMNDSVRAGVHVHINIQDLNLVQLYTFITLCLIMENSLAEYCGKSRIGNLFCLRSGDAQHFLKVLQDVAQTGNLMLFHTDDIRYAFMNMKAIIEHGSIEFRAMRSTTDFDRIMNWVNLLAQLKTTSLRFNTPRDVVEMFTAVGPQNFKASILESYAPLLEFSNSKQLLTAGFNTAQDIAYCTAWEKLNNIGCNNPFSKATAVKGSELFPNTQPKAIKYVKLPKGSRRRPRKDDGLVSVLAEAAAIAPPTPGSWAAGGTITTFTTTSATVQDNSSWVTFDEGTTPIEN